MAYAPQRRYLPHEQPLVDRYTVGHAGVGALYALGDFPLPLIVALAAGWELAENPLKDQFPGWFPDARHDRYANALMDAAALVAAYLVTRALLPPRCPNGSCPGYR